MTAEEKKTQCPMSKRQQLALATISASLGTVIFLTAFLSMKLNIGLAKFNQPILSWMVIHRTSTLTDIAKVITSLGSTLYFAGIVAIVVLFWFIYRKEVWRPFLFGSGIVVAVATSTILKFLIMDHRPPQISMVPLYEIDYSFPSGHTLAITTFILVLGYLIYSRHFSLSKYYGWLIAAVTAAVIIALTRLYLGYHWLTDVIASAGLALIILAIIIAIDLIFKEKIKSSSLDTDPYMIR